MLVVVLTVIAAWLVLSVLASAAYVLVARGGLDEDRLRTDFLEHADERAPAVPRPR